MRIELGKSMTIGEIAKACGGLVQNNSQSLITHICTDTRELKPRDLFIALKGKRFDGANYVLEAKNKGAFLLSNVKNISDIFHPDTGSALLDFASNYVKTLPYILYRIGITGSVGKTTTKEFAKILLSDSFITHASEENYNNEIGMPLSLLAAKEDTQVLLMEMGMNASGEISRLSKCLRPNIALITNIGTAHIGKLGNRENIAKAKLEILDGVEDGILLVPSEEILLSGVKENECFSLSDESAKYHLKQVEEDKIEVYNNRQKICESRFALSEVHHRACLLSACAIAIKAGVSAEQLSNKISHISNDNTRQSVIFAKNCYFHCDCYNASRESMLSAIDEFEKADFSGKKSLVLGDILELGDMTNAIHFEIGKSISPDKIYNLFLFGNNAQIIGKGAISNGFPRNRIYINTDLELPKLTANQIKIYCSDGEHFLLKASRGVKMERIMFFLI